MIPKISIIVVLHDMQREAPRTLFSLSTQYQRNVSSSDYEVIIMENGSDNPFDEKYLETLNGDFKYFYILDPSPSPVSAVKQGIQRATGEIIGLVVDGARILSPGIIYRTKRIFSMFENPFVATLAWHLGSDIQQRNVRGSYTSVEEDALLKSIDWKNSGYRLFEISTLAPSSQYGWFGNAQESNCCFLYKHIFEKLGGFDDRFNLPGGGYMNLDFYRRAIECPDLKHVILLGEGTFHQVHGGISTNDTDQTRMHKNQQEWIEQYEIITGLQYRIPESNPAYVGKIPENCRRFIVPGHHLKE